jgi:hypothetical protein
MLESRLLEPFGHLDRFQCEMERHIDRFQQAYFATTTVDYWLSIQLELFGAIIMALITCLVTFATENRSGIPAAHTQRGTRELTVHYFGSQYTDSKCNVL